MDMRQLIDGVKGILMLAQKASIRQRPQPKQKGKANHKHPHHQEPNLSMSIRLPPISIHIPSSHLERLLNDDDRGREDQHQQPLVEGEGHRVEDLVGQWDVQDETVAQDAAGVRGWVWVVVWVRVRVHVWV